MCNEAQNRPSRWVWANEGTFRGAPASQFQIHSTGIPWAPQVCKGPCRSWGCSHLKALSSRSVPCREKPTANHCKSQPKHSTSHSELMFFHPPGLPLVYSSSRFVVHVLAHSTVTHAGQTCMVLNAGLKWKSCAVPHYGLRSPVCLSVTPSIRVWQSGIVTVHVCVPHWTVCLSLCCNTWYPETQ